MQANFLWMPVLHGALGWWDELINLIPVVVGIVLVLYLYRSSRHRRDEDAAPPEADADQDEAGLPEGIRNDADGLRSHTHQAGDTKV